MRWHVHGTDATTERDVMLTVDEPDAAQAAKVAMDRQILVSHVTREKGMRRRLFPVACGALLAVGGMCAGLYVQNLGMRDKLSQALDEQARMARSVALAEHLAAEIRQNGDLAAGPAAQVNQIAEQLSAARRQMSMTEAELSDAHQRMEALENAAMQLPELRSQVAAATAQWKESQGTVGKLKEELSLQARRMEELNNAKPLPDSVLLPRVTALESANKELQGQVELLKGQLLVAVAQSTAPAETQGADRGSDGGGGAAETGTVADGGGPWALLVSYDAAKDFLNLHFDLQSLASTPGAGRDLILDRAAKPTNAAGFRLLRDRAKERVYNAILTVSLAADAPKDKLAENVKLIGEFVKAFAPSVRDADDIVSGATAQLAKLDSSRRLVFLGNDYKLTVWNDRQGLFTWKMESPRGELEADQAPMGVSAKGEN